MSLLDWLRQPWQQLPRDEPYPGASESDVTHDAGAIEADHKDGPQVTGQKESRK